MVFSNPPKGGLTLSSPTSPVPLSGQQFLSVEIYVTPLPSEYLTLSKNPARNEPG